MTKPRRYHPLNNSFDAKKPEEDLEIGPWICMTAKPEHRCIEFLEAHPSDRGDGVVVRVSEFLVQEIRLGRCVILDRKKAIALRDRLSAIIEVLPEGNHDD